MPEAWDVIEMDDYVAHSKYPHLVEEMMEGFVQIYGRRPDQFNFQRESSECFELLNTNDEVQNLTFCLSSVNCHCFFQLRRVTLLNVSKDDTYMADMVHLLSSFEFGK